MKKKKKHRQYIHTVLITGTVLLMAGCGQNARIGNIHVLSRESGSGTRSAFDDAFSIENTDPKAEVTSSTAVVMQTVAGDTQAMGYISLGSNTSSQIRTLKVDGVECTQNTVKDGSYPVVRPFLLVYSTQIEKADTDSTWQIEKDFLDFIGSQQGKQILEKAGYVPVLSDTSSYTSNGLQGSLTIGGSSSMATITEVLAEAYETYNPGTHISVEQSDSTTGISNAADGTYDMGMSSRELAEEECEQSVTAAEIARDGIALIVSPENDLDNITREEVKEIYEGRITNWKAVR